MLPSGVSSVNDAASSPSSSISVAAHLQCGPRVAARRTAVVAEVADVGRREVVRPSAAHAVARVGRVLERGPGVPRIVDAERDRAGAAVREIADLWVVPVDDQNGVGRERRRCRAPALGDVLELAVAVELVTEEVAEQDRPRPDAADDLRQGALVDLEQPQLGVAAGRAASRRRRRRGSRPSCSRRGVSGSRGSRRPSPSSSSCRSWPTRPRRPAAAGPPARRSRRDRASRAASRAGWCRRRRPRPARDGPPRGRRTTRRRGGRSRRGA